MRRRIVFLMMMVLAGTAAWFSLRTAGRQPSYEGKPILDWAVELLGPNQTATATRVFQQAGSEAVPVLAAAVVRRDSFFRRPIVALGSRVSDKWRVRLYEWFNPFKEERLRIAAVSALIIMGPKAEAAAPALNRAFHSHHPAIQARAALALGRIGKPALPHLVSALKDPDPKAPPLALQAIGSIGVDAAEAVPALVAYLGNPLSPSRKSAAAALARIGRPAVPDLLKLLRRDETYLQGLAVHALGEIGPLARSAAPGLIELYQSNTDVLLRKAVLEALSKIWPPGIVDLLTAALRDSDPNIRSSAAAALERGGAASEPYSFLPEP